MCEGFGLERIFGLVFWRLPECVLCVSPWNTSDLQVFCSVRNNLFGFVEVAWLQSRVKDLVW
jgi:hypothetical protein